MYDIFAREIPEDLKVTARSRDFTFEDTPEHFRTHHIFTRKWRDTPLSGDNQENRSPKT